MRGIKIIFAVIAVTFIVFYCRDMFLQKREPALDTAGMPREEAPITGEKARIFSISGFSHTGKKVWEMHGKSADIFSDIINLSDINAVSYGDKVKVSLEADKGVFIRGTNDIELTGNVRIVTDEGTTLDTATLNWTAKEGLVYTDAKVFIKRKEMDIAGTGALSRHTLKLAQLDTDINVSLKKPVAVITCDGPLEVDYEKNIAYFNNNVKVVDKETSINTDKATAYFEPRKRSLKMVFCQGNVSIKRGEDITYAKQLTYLPGEGRVMLEGRPKIIIRSSNDLLQRHKEKKENSGEYIKDRKSS
jgi:LPS export ABC transporter protein LptC